MASPAPTGNGPAWIKPLAAVGEGDTLVVPKLDRLARSVPDARDIGDSLAQRGIKLSLGGQVYDPTDPMGKMFFNILATFAEFEVDLLRMRTREGMTVAQPVLHSPPHRVGLRGLDPASISLWSALSRSRTSCLVLPRTFRRIRFPSGP
jgi:hypothetical protein